MYKAKVSRRFRIIVLILITLLVAHVAENHTLAMPATSPQAAPRTYLVTPGQGRAGKDYDLLVMSDDSACTSKHELAKAKLIAPEGTGVTVISSNSSDCTLTARIRVAAEAPIGRVTFWVTNDETKPPLGIAQFSISDFVQPGQIPPGLNSPAVDVMWSVMPSKIVGDNFGSSIAKKFYAIEIIIGNNAAYTLQLVSVGFELPSDRELEGLIQRNATNRSGGGTSKKEALDKNVLAAKNTPIPKPLRLDRAEGEPRTLLPTSSYKITRGSLEAKQLLHMRTLVLSTITALGPIFTGFTPYFHNVNHAANFAEGINILSNPIEKGLELVWPDPRSRQRDRFDDQVLRDGLIIKNNTQVRTLAFFPKELLRLPTSVESDSEYSAWKNNAREVRERLGKIVIIGDMIQYVNRISLSPNPPGPVESPPTIHTPSPSRIKQGVQAQQITIVGSNLSGALLSAEQTTGISFSNVTVDETGHTVKATVKVDDTVAPGDYLIVVSTPAGTDEMTLVIEPEKIGQLGLKYEKPKEGSTNSVSIEITGKFLHNATLTAPPEFTLEDVQLSETGTSVKAVVRLKSGTKAGKYKIKVSDDTYPDNVKTVEFEVLPKD
jgi:hypothetical protein